MDSSQSQLDTNLAWANLERSQQTDVALAQGEDAPPPPPPEITAEQAARIQARPRRTPKSSGVPAAQSSGSSSRPHQPLATLTNACPSSQSTMQAPDPNLLANMEARFDAKLAAENARWEETFEGHLEEKKKWDREKRTAFAKGKEAGEKAAIAEHAAWWKSMDDQLAAEKKALEIREKKLDGKLGEEKARLEGLHRDRTDALTADVASKEKQIATQVEEINRLNREGQAYVDGLKKELTDKDVQLNRNQAQMATYVGNMQQQQLLAQQTTQQTAQQTTRLQSHLRADLRLQHDARRANIRADLNKLTSQFSRLRLNDRFPDCFPEAANLMPTPADSAANVTNQQLQQRLAGHQKINKRLQQDVSHGKAKSEALRQSLASCRSERDEKLAAAYKEHGRLQGAIYDLERDMEVSCAKLGRQIEASQEADRTIQAFRDREGDLEQEQKRLVKKNKATEASLAKKNRECGVLIERVEKLDASLRQAEKNVEAVRGEWVLLGAKTCALRDANQALVTDNQSLAEQSSSASTELNTALAELDWRRTHSKWMTVELERVSGELENCEGIIDKQADEVRELDAVVDGRLEAWERVLAVVKEVDQGEREMDAPLGIPEKAIEGFLQPQFPRWKEMIFWLLVILVLGMSLVSFSAVTAASRERELRLDVTRRAVLALHAGLGSQLSWQELLLDLSRDI